MRKLIVTFAFLILNVNLHSQTFNQSIQVIINETNLDSLVSCVKILSGEDSVRIADSVTIIEHRRSSLGNDKAADYILEKLESFGLNSYDERYSESGRNIYAFQEGTSIHKKLFILCAHYDSVTDFCADDNASGVSAVLEAARILSQFETKHSILYALWDEEEIGYFGSAYYANNIDTAAALIEGVINLDMIAYDSNNDNLAEIQVRDYANSNALADIMLNIDSVYSNPINPIIINPGAANSDHRLFWYSDISAILLSETYRSGDFNTYYHSPQDRIDKFNLDYYHNMVKLAVGTTASLAMDQVAVSAESDRTIPTSYKLSNYPNPFNPATTIVYSLPEAATVKFTIYNSLGQQVRVISEEYKAGGNHSFVFDGSNLSSGVYFCIFQAGNSTVSHKLLLLK